MKEKRMKDIVEVSLFNGLSGARLALKEVPHLNVLRCYSSEVDKYAIKVADHNFPQDIPYKLGDVTKVDGVKLKEEILKEFGDVEVLLVGGSPCQGFSMAGKLKGSSTKCGKDVVTLEQYLVLKEMGFEFDGQSYLFWEYVRVWKELNPTYFLLENVRVTKKWLPMFNDAMGVEPTRINSRLLSAQNRDRCYWHNLGHIEQPNDERQHLVIRDILEDTHEINYDSENLIVKQATKKGYIEVAPGDCFDLTHPNSKTRRGRDMSEKSNTIMANTPEYYQYLARPCELRDYKEDSICHHTATDIKGNESIKRVYAETGKAPSVTTCQGGHREPKVLIGAARGRYIVDGKRQDGKMKTAGLTEQMLEVISDEKSNCLTTVQKDNYVVSGLQPGTRTNLKNVTNADKPIRVGTLNKGSQGDRIYSVEGKGIALSSQSGGTAGNGSMLIDKIKNVNLNEKNINFMNAMWCKDTRWRKMKNPIDGKSGTVCATIYKGLPRGVVITDVELQEKVYKDGICDMEDFKNNKASYRKLTPRECARLQMIPDAFEFPVSNSQAYKMIGNGFTISVVAYILGHIKGDAI